MYHEFAASFCLRATFSKASKNTQNKRITMKTTVLNDELKKFSKLCFDSKENMPMFSQLIDSYWHILSERTSSIELPFHDTTVRSSTSIIIKWVPHYELYYGKLNKAWFIDSEGKFLSDKYNDYLITGKVLSDFNCSGVRKNK